MTKVVKNIKVYFVILFLIIAFFTILELIWWQSDPIIHRSSDKLIKQGIVILSMSLILFFIIQFFVPYYKKRVTKKLKNKFPDSKMLDAYTLELNPDERMSILLTIDKTLFNKNRIEITCKNHDSDLSKKLGESFRKEYRNNQSIFVNEIIAEDDKDIYKKYMEFIKTIQY